MTTSPFDLTLLAPLFRAKFTVNASTGCWDWTAARSRGYGRSNNTAGSNLAHVHAYTVLIGPVPAGLILDHSCHNADPECPGGDTCIHRSCVNPSHLEPVTQEENTRRAAQARARCRAGHLWSETARARSGDEAGQRKCRTCQHIYQVRRNYRLTGHIPHPASMQRLGLTVADLAGGGPVAEVAPAAERRRSAPRPLTVMERAYAAWVPGGPSADEIAAEMRRSA